MMSRSNPRIQVVELRDNASPEPHLPHMRALRLSRLLIAGALLATLPGCSGILTPAADEVFIGVGPPPRSWRSAITFYLQDSVRVEFFDGVRTRVVTSRESIAATHGSTPWYRIDVRDTLATVLHVKMTFPGAGVATAEYPMAIERDAFYGVWIGMSGFDARRIISASEPRAYPVPAAAQTTPADSLWIYWGARSRDCWSCPR